MKLLLAEDEVELSNALCAILKHAGYSVDAVYNGKDAYEYARVGSYDGLILDIMMPGMDGTENAAHGGKDYAGAFSDGAAGSERPGQRT